MSLESIKNKTAVEGLEQVLGNPISKEGRNVYRNWWNLQHGIV